MESTVHFLDVCVHCSPLALDVERSCLTSSLATLQTLKLLQNLDAVQVRKRLCYGLSRRAVRGRGALPALIHQYLVSISSDDGQSGRRQRPLTLHKKGPSFFTGDRSLSLSASAHDVPVSAAAFLNLASFPLYEGTINNSRLRKMNRTTR